MLESESSIVKIYFKLIHWFWCTSVFLLLLPCHVFQTNWMFLYFFLPRVLFLHRALWVYLTWVYSSYPWTSWHLNYTMLCLTEAWESSLYYTDRFSKTWLLTYSNLSSCTFGVIHTEYKGYCRIKTISKTSYLNLSFDLWFLIFFWWFWTWTATIRLLCMYL